ncbi:MAG: cupredoxin domain-containing protein [Chloroflexota bacterium]|nr:cupredoxin domain-containing protein [Chloroflexota bacterium]
MLDQIWTAILDFTSKLVIPDWGALIGLIPVALAAVVVLWLVMTVYRFATIGPRRRGKRRLTPRPPPGIHAPGPSFAPVIAAIGVFLLLFGLVVGGIALPLGAVALALSLLYWGREGLADYDHLTAGGHSQGAVAVMRQPPPGVHMPGPSFRPLLASLALAVLLYGFVFGGWLLAVGVIFLIVTLLGWLRDARAEYGKAIDADRTGHLEALPAPGWPRTLLAVMGILLVGAVVLNLGLLPPKSPTAAGGGPGASGAPPGSGGPGGSGGPSGSGGPGGADVTIVAEGVKFTTTDVSAPAGKPFTILFDNRDASTPHDVVILGADGSKLFAGQTTTGPSQTRYNVPALPAGTYKFECSIHPSLMTGTLKAG